MCSASMGAEGSVTLQLREAVEAPDSNDQSDNTTALTIGYSESDLIESIQAAGTKFKFNLKLKKTTTTNDFLHGFYCQ